VGVEETH